MPISTTQRNYTVLNQTFTAVDPITSETGTLMDYVTLSPAIPATLTTRTNDTQGVITAEAGHGIESGALDVYFPDGCRYGATATVDGNAITIASGTGDNLPAVNSAVTLFVPVSEAFSIPASSAKILLVSSPNGKMVTRFRTAVPAVSLAVVQKSGVEDLWSWDSLYGGDNPLSTDAITTVLLSNGGLEAVKPVIVAMFSTS
jgi:hypothetical protein